MGALCAAEPGCSSGQHCQRGLWLKACMNMGPTIGAHNSAAAGQGGQRRVLEECWREGSQVADPSNSGAPLLPRLCACWQSGSNWLALNDQ